MNNVFWVQLTQMLYRQTFIFRVICKRFNWERSQTGSNLMCFTPDTIWLQFPFLIRQPWEVVVSQTLPMAVSLERTQFLPGLLRCFLPRGFVQHSNVQLQGWMVVGCTCGMRWSELGGSKAMLPWFTVPGCVAPHDCYTNAFLHWHLGGAVLLHVDDAVDEWKQRANVSFV